MQNKPVNLQDTVLNRVRKDKTPLTIHLINGYQINKALVQSFDNFVLLVTVNEKQMLLYKHAISSITPQDAIVFEDQERDAK